MNALFLRPVKLFSEIQFHCLCVVCVLFCGYVVLCSCARGQDQAENNGGLCDWALVPVVSSLIARCWSSTITRPNQFLRLSKFLLVASKRDAPGQRAQSIRGRYETNVL